MNLPKRILFAAHDPGGANAILPVVRELRTQGVEVYGLLAGPACTIFARENIPFVETLVTEETALEKEISSFDPDIFLAATSGAQGSIDKKILRLLKKSVPSLYVLDFWSNFWQRFSGETKDFAYLPDKICVMDESAKQDMLRQGFPEQVVVATGNPYFEEFAKDIRTDGDMRRILFISQPLSTDTELEQSLYGFTEYDALTGLLHVLKTLPQDYVCDIRLHPREPAEKYAEFLSARVRRAPEPTLEEALSQAGMVVGMFSPVLMQAAVAGKPVVSFEPGMSEEHDPLPTNRMGITKRCATEEELAKALDAYVRGAYPTATAQLSSVWPSGATERILREIRALHKRN